MASRVEGPPSIPTAPDQPDLHRLRRARTLRRLLLAVLGLVVLGALSTLLGPRTSTVSASVGDYSLSVTYPAMSRPGLAIRWRVEVRHPGGFEGPLTISTDSNYFDLFDFNNLDPVPESQTTDGRQSVWTFAAPPSDVFRVTMDGRVEPAQQFGKETTTSLIIPGSAPITVRYTTRLSP